MSELKVVHFTQSVDPRHGGVASQVCNLVLALASKVTNQTVFVTDHSCPLAPNLPASLVHLAPSEVAKGLLNVRLLPANVQGEFGGDVPVVIHSHGLWAPAGILAAKMALRYGLPLVISPHGMLMPNALKHRSMKKWVALHIYQRKIIDQAAIVHTTSELERLVVCALHPQSDVARIGFGLEPEAQVLAPHSHTCQGFREVRYMLFLGRIDPIKNLESLIRAWVSADRVGWKLVLCGPASDEYLRSLKKLSGSVFRGETVDFRGPTFGSDKWALLRNAHALILPSHTENFGAVVLEALSVGTPVIVSDQTPWSDVVESQCGWMCGTDYNELASAINECQTLTSVRENTMRVNARKFAVEHFSWNALSNDYLNMYLSARNYGHVDQ